MSKKILIGAFGVVLLLVGLAIVKFYLLSPRFRAAPEMKAEASPDALARGQYLVDHVTGCLGCHSAIDETQSGEPPVPGRLGSGRDFGAMPGFPGHLIAPNLTPDKETGLGAWSDGEIARAIREGVSRDGHALFPMMPYVAYSKTLTDADVLAIIAYLRTLSPNKNDPGKTKIDFPVSMFIRAVPAPLTQAAAPPAADTLSRGQWLLTACSCHDCHDSVNARHEPIAGKALAGGMAMPIPGRGQVYAANISSDLATGIGAYSDDDLLRVLSSGKNKAGAPLYGMPWLYYSGLTETDKRALIAALRAGPAIVNAVPAPAFAR